MNLLQYDKENDHAYDFYHDVHCLIPQSEVMTFRCWREKEHQISTSVQRIAVQVEIRSIVLVYVEYSSDVWIQSFYNLHSTLKTGVISGMSSVVPRTKEALFFECVHVFILTIQHKSSENNE